MKKTQSIKLIFFSLIFILLLSLISCQNIDEINVPVSDGKKEFYTTKLDNELTVTVKEVKNLPLVTIQFWIKTGSRNENDENRGISHIFEHIWFKGTPTQPVGSFDRKVASYGGYANAMTGQDFTAFYVIVPSDEFENTLELMADLFKNQLFDEDEIAREKEVILEEQKLTYNDPAMWADEQFGQLIFKEHPYRNPILGYVDTIKANSPEKIKEHYKKWYAPNNMNLVVVGDLPKERIIRAAQMFMGDMQIKDLPIVKIPEEPEQKEMRYEVKTRKGLENTYVSLGYKAPNFKDKDWYVMRVLTQILDGAENSRLSKILKQEKELITSSQSFYLPLQDHGAIETMLVLEPKNENEAIQAALDEYNKFKQAYVSEEEIESAKKQLQAGYALQQEEIVMQGIDIGQWWVSGEFTEQPEYLQNIFKVSKEDVKRVAEKYFTQPTIFVLKPE